MKQTPSLPVLLESYFTQRLMVQRQASPHTIASYRDTFRLLLRFAKNRCGKSPSDLNLTDLDAPLISAFLNDLEKRRGSSVSSRNVRLLLLAARWLQTSPPSPPMRLHSVFVYIVCIAHSSCD